MKTKRILSIAFLLLSTTLAQSLFAQCSVSFRQDLVGSYTYQFFATANDTCYDNSLNYWDFGPGSSPANFSGPGNPIVDFGDATTRTIYLRQTRTGGVTYEYQSYTITPDSTCFVDYDYYVCGDSVYINVDCPFTTIAYVDWGDGSPVQTVTPIGSYTYAHYFPTASTYRVKVWAPLFLCGGITDTFYRDITLDYSPAIFDTHISGSTVTFCNTHGYWDPNLNNGVGGNRYCYWLIDGHWFISPDSCFTYTFGSAGPYTVYHKTLADSSLDCPSNYTSQTITIACSPPIIILTISNPTPGAADGSILANVTGGSGPYSFLWSTGATTPTLSGLAAGTYCLTVTDAIGCAADTCIVLPSGSSSCDVYFSYTPLSSFLFQFYGTATDSIYWSFGDGTYSSLANPIHSFPSSGVYWVTAYNISSVHGVCDSFTQIMTILRPDTLSGIVWEDADADGIIDASELPIGGQEVLLRLGSSTYATTYTDTLGYYQFTPNVFDTTHFVVELGTLVPSEVQTYPLLPTNYPVMVYGSGTHVDGLRFGIQDSSGSISTRFIHIQGYVYEDANANGVKDPTEHGIGGQRVYIGSYSAITNPAGFYTIMVPFNSYTLSYIIPATLSGYTHTSPSSINLVPVLGTWVYHNNNFGIYYGSTYNDLCVDVVPITNVSPLGYISYWVIVQNTGTNTVSGTTRLFYDSRYTYSYSSPAGTHTAPTSTVEWTFTALSPGARRYFYVRFDAPIALSVGTAVFNTAFVEIASGLSEREYDCNTDTLHQIVEASWDPNDKAVNPPGEGVEGVIFNNTRLSYTIRFQNTGTAAAANVVIMDTIDTDLDLETFQLTASSHDVRTMIEGRTLKFYFDNIMLPDSVHDEPGSHGFVQYKISLNPFLTEGTTIQNNADIYFDYNEPVRTNTTLNTIAYRVAIDETSATNIRVSVYPNPFSTELNLTIEGTEKGTASFNIYNALGNLVISKNIALNREEDHIHLDMENLSDAVYYFEIIQNKESISSGSLVRTK